MVTKIDQSSDSIDIVYILEDIITNNLKFIFLNILYYKTRVDTSYFVLCDLNLKESEMLQHSIDLT